MAGLRISGAHPVWGICMILATLLSLASPAKGDNDMIEYIPYTTDDGTIYLDNDRQPSLYTGSFGDCQGNSLIDISRFDASLYTDNMTVMLHLQGTTNLPSQKVMLLISVQAYGESRLDMLINPCTIDTPTLCPMRPGVPIIANGLIPIGAENLADVPDIAYSIPDFEGQAVLRIFEYPSLEQVACYAAAMTNGNSFSHPNIVGSILGLFTVIALVSSVAVAIYGHMVRETRIHYAHSVSMFVVFSVFHHIFFSGTLSVNWPSVLVAFWSNYAWTAGMIYSASMQNSISSFIGYNFGDISRIGAIPTNTNVSNLGGSYGDAQTTSVDGAQRFAARSVLGNMNHAIRRSSDIEDKSTGFIWYGDPVRSGLPLPGNYSGFAGTLSELSIPASNVFLTGLIWLLIAMLIVSASMIMLKGVVELCVSKQWTKSTGWNSFRNRWLFFTGIAMLRLCYIAFFMMATLTLFQFSFGGAAGVLAIACIVFVLFVAGLVGVSAYALWFRLRSEKFQHTSDELQMVSRKRGIGLELKSNNNCDPAHNSHKVLCSFPWTKIGFVDPENRPHVHEDADYTLRFGWLASRFRKSKWWFFSFWLFYELIRACFYGGAVTNSLVQIIGLLVWEIVAFVVMVIMKPFESSRLNLIMVYMLGLSKIATVALSLAFEPRFALGRILTTAVGIIIIIIQGVLTLCLLFSIALGAAASYMSFKRDHDNSTFKPRVWVGYRARYFANIEQKAVDQRIIIPVPEPELEKPKEPQFAVTTVRRELKIEDQEKMSAETNSRFSQASMDQSTPISPYISRPASIRSYASNVPFGARLSKATWSTRDLSTLDRERMPPGPHLRTSFESIHGTSTRHRAASYRDPYSKRISLSSMDNEARAMRRSTMSAVHTGTRASDAQTPQDATTNVPLRAMQTMSWPRTHVHEVDDDDAISFTESEAWPAVEWSPDDILPQNPFQRPSHEYP